MQAEGEAFRKDFIREGSWRLPNGDKFSVDRERMDRWASNFKLFRERGISVPLTVDHIQTTDENGKEVSKKLTPAMAEAKRGEVVGLFREDNLGMFDAKPADADAEQLMHRCPEVSLEVTHDIIDSDGNYYDEAITAITLTPIPVVPGQQGWEKLHLSKEGLGSTVYLSAEPITAAEAIPEPQSQEKKTMFSKEQLSRAKSALGLVDTTPDTEVETAMLCHVESNSAPKLTALSRENQALRESKGEQQLDEEAAEALIASFENRVSNLIITPAQKTILSKVLDAQKSSRKAVFLSRKAAEKNGMDKAVLDTVISIFEAGKPEEMADLLKQRTGTQTRKELSRKEAGHTDGEEFNADLNKKMIENANARATGGGTNTVL